MGNNLTATSGEDKPKEYKKKLNSIFFSPSSSLPSSTLNIQNETQEDYLYNLFKNYNYKQLHNLYLEYEYLELIKENFYLNYKLPRVTINESNNVQTTQIIKFYFITSSNMNNSNEFIKIDAQTLINSSSYFKRLISSQNTAEQEIKFYLNKNILTYNEMYFVKKFLNTNRINFELFFNSIPLPDSTQLKSSQHQFNNNTQVNEENISKLLEFYYKSTFFEIDSLNAGILTPEIEGVGVGVDVDYTYSYSYT